MSTWVLVGNPATNTAHTEIYAGDMSTPKSTHDIPPGGRVTPQYAELMDGPVKVVSTNGVKVFTSERSLYKDSFNEVMGVPSEQLSTEYWFPWYDQVGMSTWVLVGNPSQTETAQVDIYVGDMTTPRSSHTIPPGGRVTPQYPGLMDGPVKVVSTNGVKVFTSERSLYKDSFNEVMGVVIP